MRETEIAPTARQPGDTASIIALAERVFGDNAKAYRWLSKPSRMFDGAIPLDLLKSAAGAEDVENALHRIEHGMLA
jgi:putative toxin-antitoxin system antitoxin component (TIGR02293 family)